MKSGWRLVGAMAALAACASAQAPQQQPRKKKAEDKEPPTQTLPLLKDPPAAVAAETSKLAFHVSPLSAKGLLSPQTREAIGGLMKTTRGAQIVKLRAFVAGTGDLRRVQSIVSEIFTDKKQPLPALSAIQVGALPLEGAQVVIESVSVEKKATHPFGLVFFSGQRGGSVAEAVQRLAEKTAEAGVTAAGMLRVTCFVGSIDQAETARGEAEHAFPMAALNFVQPLRAEGGSSAVCEGVGSRGRAGAEVEVSAEAAAVSTPKLIFSGAQMAFGDQDGDVRLAFQRLGKALESLGVSHQDVVFSSVYPLTPAVEEKVGRIGGEFVAPGRKAAGTTVFFEELPSLDASMAVEIVAAGR